MPDADLGNPNFFKTFLGRFEAELPDGGKTPVMLTAMNEVCLMQDLTADSDGLVMTLPEQCRPKNPVRFACVAEKPASGSAVADVPVATEANVPLPSSAEAPVPGDVDIPVLENVSLDSEAGNLPETVVTVNPDGNVTGVPGAMHRLNGRAFYVIDRYYL